MASETRPATLEKWKTFAEAYIMLGEKPQEAARIAGYSGNNPTLSATASRLLARDEVRRLIDDRRAQLRAQGNLPATTPELVRERLAISFQDKREFLWGLAHECAKVVELRDVDEHMDENGTLIRTTTITTSMFRPKEAIEAIAQLNEMDGDIAPPKPQAGAGGFSIEQLLLSITQNNH